MNKQTQRHQLAGPAGLIDCAVDLPELGVPRGLALVCHPHPLHGGSMDNKVVQTLARAFVQLGYTALRFNFRGVGASEGSWGEGVGEIDDALAVLDQLGPQLPGAGGRLQVAGFSFGGYVASHVAARRQAAQTVLVAPAVLNFSAASVSASSLLIHGETDDVVPLQAVLDWARPQALPVTVLPGAGHFFHGQLPLLRQLVVDGLVGREPR